MTHPAPLELWRETIRPEWIDHNGHMNVAYYTLVFDHAVDAFFEYVGLGQPYRDHTNGSTFAVEQHITYNREVLEVLQRSAAADRFEHCGSDLHRRSPVIGIKHPWRVS